MEVALPKLLRNIGSSPVYGSNVEVGGSSPPRPTKKYLEFCLVCSIIYVRGETNNAHIVQRIEQGTPKA